MAVFTCAEMVAGCVAGDAGAWRFFVRQYEPFASALLARHAPGPPERQRQLVERALLGAREQDAQFCRDYQGHSEREFLLHWRDHVLAPLAPAAPAAPDWDAFQTAAPELTALERQILWLAVLSPAGDSDQMLRLSADTIAAATAKAEKALAALGTEQRAALAVAARARRTAECPPPKKFLRLLDGQITWRDRGELELHLTACWGCVDLLCRFREVAHVAESVQPLEESAAEPYFALLGLPAERRSGWRRLLAH